MSDDAGRPLRRSFVCRACWPLGLHHLCDVLRCDCAFYVEDGDLRICDVLLLEE